MVVIGERQVLDMIIHTIAQVIAHLCRNPLGEVTVAQSQYGRAKPKCQKEKSRTDQVNRLTARQTFIDHRLDDTRHDQVESGDREQYEQCRQYLPEIWF